MAEIPEQQYPRQTPKEPPEEKLEFLKRREVRTMEKDIASIREQQANRERERIAEFKQYNGQQETNQTGETSKVLQAQKPFDQNSQASFRLDEQPIPKQPPTHSQKFLIRLVIFNIIIFVLLNISALGFWYFFRRDAAPQPPPSQEVPIPQPQPQP